MRPPKIVLASTSAVKLEACLRAFGPGADIVTVKVPSGVNEQPMDLETLQGAWNRLEAARAARPDADLYVAIESGVFDEETAYVDRALVVIEHKTGLRVNTSSDGVIFPDAAVEEARRRGLDKWTVGKVMQEQGTVASHDDPHLTLVGRSRSEFIDKAVRRAVDAYVQASVDKVVQDAGFRALTPEEMARLGGQPSEADAPAPEPKTIPVTPVYRVHAWVVHLREDLAGPTVTALDPVEGARAAYTLGLGSKELYREGFPQYCLLPTQPLEHPDDLRAAKALVGPCVDASARWFRVGPSDFSASRWFRVNAYDFAAAQVDRLFDPGDGKLVRQVEWAGLADWFARAREVVKQQGMLYLLLCLEAEPRINFVVRTELGATLRDEAGQVIATREGLRVGMRVTAYTDVLLTVHHDEAHGFYLGGRDSIMMSLVFTEGRGWHVGVVGNLSGIKRLELYR